MRSYPWFNSEQFWRLRGQLPLTSSKVYRSAQYIFYINADRKRRSSMRDLETVDRLAITRIDGRDRLTRSDLPGD